MIDIWQEIYSTIKRNKLRTFLTGFAVAWGIFMLIVLLGAGNGLIHAFEQSASERAMNSIKISRVGQVILRWIERRKTGATGQ